MTRRTHYVAALLAAAFAIPLAVSLATRVPPIQRIPINPESREGGFPAYFRGQWSIDPDGAFYGLRIWLRTADPRRLLAHQQIGLQVLVYDTPPELQDGELSFAGTGCTFRTAHRPAFTDGAPLMFSRGAGCGRLEGEPTGDVRMLLRLREPASAALRTLLRDATTVPPGALLAYTFSFAPPSGALLVQGTLADPVDGSEPASRLSLLTYVWGLSASSAWIVALLAVATMALYAAALIVSTRPAAAVFLAALALAASYAVIVPPFQAADEPVHMMTVAGVLGRPDLESDALAFARRGHFEEVRTARGPFSPVDRDRPGSPWTGVSAPNTMRGTGAETLWRVLAPALRGASTPRVLLTLRLFHGLLFSIAAGLFVVAVRRGTEVRAPQLLAIPLFLVPALPYFGMHLSNYAPLAGVYVLFAAGVAIAQWDGPRSHWAAGFIGACLTIGMALARSAVPLVGLAAGLGLARLCLGDRDGRRSAAAWYWGLLTATTVAGLIVANAAYPEGPERAIIRYRIAQSSVTWLLHHPWWLAIPGAMFAGIEIALAPLRRRLAAPSPRRAALVRAIACGAAALMFVWLALSPWLLHPIVNPLDSRAIVSLTGYVREVVPACLAWLRFGHPDVLTSLTFWGGFGWLETRLPGRIVAALSGVSGLALVALLAWIGRERSGRALFWIACAAGGYVLSAAAYAFTSRLIFADVHGRYLLGLYLSALVIGWSAVARWAGTDRRVAAATTVAGAACVAAHAYALTFLLARYF